jgi:glutamine synthetase
VRRGPTARARSCARQLARARDLGFELKLGLELEYFLVERREDGSIVVADAEDTLEKPCYDMAGLTRQYEFLTTVSRYCNELGWGNYANDHEDANGQFEQNFRYDDALVSCDRAIFFRYMVHTLAEHHGMIATFMPKPFTNLTGTGCHFHVSLWRDGERDLDPGEPNSENLFAHSYEELTARGLRALPANLLEAIGELEADEVLRVALGRGRDEDYVEYYARVKRDEWFRYHEQVTAWEVNEYLTRW